MATTPRLTRHILTMAGGTIAAQAIPFAIAPVLTRLYPPDAFGALALFTVFVTLGGVLATGRYDLAIVLPEADADAATLAAFALILALGVCAAGLALFWPLAATVGDLLKNPVLTPWLPLVPLAVLCLAWNQVLIGWANRLRQYGQIAGSAAVQQTTTGTSAIAAGLLGSGPGGLVGSSVAGQVAAAAYMGRANWEGVEQILRGFSVKRARTIAHRYRQFPAYNLPYSFIGGFTRDFLLVAFSGFGFPAIAGYLSLSRRILYAPVVLLSGALGQVWYKEAAVGLGTPEFERLTVRMLQGIAALATPAAVFIGFWLPAGFPVIFGREWAEAGLYAQLFLPAAFCFLFTSWPERIYEAAGRQRRAFAIQVTSDGLLIGLVMVLLGLKINPLYVVGAYSLGYSAYHCVYLSTIFRVARFDRTPLRALFLQVGGLGVASAGILLALRQAPLPLGFEFGIGLVLVGMYTLERGWRLIARARQVETA